MDMGIMGIHYIETTSTLEKDLKRDLNMKKKKKSMCVGIGENPYIESISTFLKIQTMKQTQIFCDGQSY
jgi:hypothetical protein